MFLLVSLLSANARNIIPETINIVPINLNNVIGSLNSQTDAIITVTTSKCEAAKAGPTGAFFNKVIQVKKVKI